MMELDSQKQGAEAGMAAHVPMQYLPGALNKGLSCLRVLWVSIFHKFPQDVFQFRVDMFFWHASTYASVLQ